MNDDLCDLDPAGLLARAGEAVKASRLAAVADLEVIAQWAVVHWSTPTPEERRRGDVLVQVGGEGTPGVRDHCLGEIALARSSGVGATRNAMADVLDLHHRLPLTWARCLAGEADVWTARKVARMSRHLPLDVVDVVDRAVARVIHAEASGRVLAVAEGAIVKADPALADERDEAERRRRYVALGQTDEHGLRLLIARIEAGDAAWIDATITRVAEIIKPRHPDLAADELRAIAFGWLARPAELLTLLVEAQQPDDEPGQQPSRATAMPADLLAALRALDLSVLAPKVALYVHLHEAALLGHGGIARAEGLGPVTLSRLTTLLAGANVTVKPVIDLANRTRSTAYEHPETIKEQVFLTTSGDYWPYATSTSRRVDYDHPTPYDHSDTGPPGQTGPHNSGPLGRRHHRWKTHAGYRSRQSGAGRYVWLTPHGLSYLVDHHGTRPIDRRSAEMIHDAPAGVDLYPGVEIEHMPSVSS